MEKTFISKFCIIIVIVAGITIALGSISGIIKDRTQHRRTAEHSIQTAWAGKQQVIGPILVLPFEKRIQQTRTNPHLNSNERYNTVGHFTQKIVPNTLDVVAKAKVEQRYRGIHSFPVYTTEITLSGDFLIPEELRDTEDIDIKFGSQATLEVAVSDVRGAGRTTINWNSKQKTTLPGVSLTGSKHGVHSKIGTKGLEPGIAIPFKVELSLKGLNSFEVAALGKNTKIKVDGNWPHPKFIGNFLPTTREMTKKDFKAEWSLSYFATGVMQTLENCNDKKCCFSEQLVGIELFTPIDLYHLTERSLKYGVLFITLTFSIFFIFEIVKALQIHPIQYGFVGAMQAVFYLLLLSLSEHIAFALAYSLATLACVLVISFYLKYVLKSKKRAMSFGACFATLYGVLYFVLISTDFALLLGTGVLFAILAAIMVLTRNIDWYSLNENLNPTKEPAMQS